MSNFKINFSSDIELLHQTIEQQFVANKMAGDMILENCEQALQSALLSNDWSIIQKMTGVIFSTYKNNDLIKEYPEKFSEIMHQIEKSTMPLELLLSSAVYLKQGKTTLFKNLSWKRGEKAINLFFNDEKIELWHSKNDTNGWEMIKLAIYKNILDTDRLKKIIDIYELKDESPENIAKKTDLLLSCSTLSSLEDFANMGVNIWISIKKPVSQSDFIETLLPFNAVAIELRKNGSVDIDANSDFVNFFINHQDQWTNFKTEKTSNEDIKTRLINVFALSVKKESESIKIINRLGIKKLNSHCLDTIPVISINEKESRVFTTQNELLKEGKIKLLNKMNTDFKDNANQAFIHLIRCVKNNKDSKKINYQKAYAKLWYAIIPHVNFKATGNDNLLHQLLLFKEVKAYLPISPSSLTQIEQKNSNKKSDPNFDTMDNDTTHSLIKIIRLIEEKGCDIYEKNSLGISSLNILTLRCMENSYSNETINKVEGYMFLSEKINNSSEQDKEQLLELLCLHWDKILPENDKKFFLKLQNDNIALNNNLFSGLKLLGTIFKGKILSEELIINKENEINCMIQDLKDFQNNSAYPQDFIKNFLQNQSYHRINTQTAIHEQHGKHEDVFKFKI
jgi:hypothetical protein